MRATIAPVRAYNICGLSWPRSAHTTYADCDGPCLYMDIYGLQWHRSAHTTYKDCDGPDPRIPYIRLQWPRSACITYEDCDGPDPRIPYMRTELAQIRAYHISDGSGQDQRIQLFAYDIWIIFSCCGSYFPLRVVYKMPRIEQLNSVLHGLHALHFAYP